MNGSRHEMVKCVEEMHVIIDEIWKVIRESQNRPAQILRLIHESQEQLKRMEPLWWSEDIRGLRYELERARERIEQLSGLSILHPFQIERIRKGIKDALQHLQMAEDGLRSIHEDVSRIQEKAKALETRCRERRVDLAEALKPIEDLLDGMRRDLSHLTESSEPYALALSMTNLLQRALQLAALIFNPADLPEMAQASPKSMGQLRQWWGDWLKALGQYIKKAYAQSLKMSRSLNLRESLEVFRAACEEIAHQRVEGI